MQRSEARDKAIAEQLGFVGATSDWIYIQCMASESLDFNELCEKAGREVAYEDMNVDELFVLIFSPNKEQRACASWALRERYLAAQHKTIEELTEEIKGE